MDVDYSAGGSAQDVWFLGSSQLIMTVIPAFCSAEILDECHADWRARRITQGELLLGSGRAARFLSCNMGTIGDPEEVSGEIRAEPGLRRFLDLVSPDAKVIISLLRGNEFISQSLVDESPHWDFSFGEWPVDPTRIFVQRADVIAHADRILAPLYTTLLLIRSRFPRADVYHVAPPPPLPQTSPHLAPEKLRADGMSDAVDLVEKYGIRPFHLRKKIYDVWYEHLAARLSRVGVRFLFAPDFCLTSEGATRSEFAADCLHGNELYGRAVVHEIEEIRLHASL